MARPRSEAARQKVLDSALQIVAEVGVGGFTVDAVAARSGVAKTTIYRHWQSGDALLMGALDCMIEPMATPNTGSLRQDLTVLYQAIVEMMEQPEMFKTMLGVLGRAASDPEFARLKHQLQHERTQPLRTVLQLAQGRGEIAADADVDLLMDLIEGPIAARKLMKLGHLHTEEIERIVDLLLDGILSKPAT